MLILSQEDPFYSPAWSTWRIGGSLWSLGGYSKVFEPHPVAMEVHLETSEAHL
jgi:hypothetical protein